MAAQLSRVTFTLAHVAATLALLAAAPAADLRIETRVYAEDQEQPVCESVTLFTGAAVYDFREDRPVVTIYQPPTAGKPGRFILVDTERKVRTELDPGRIDHAMDSLRKYAVQSKDEYLRFAGDPVFTESYNEETGELQLIGEQLSYRLVTVPLEDEAARLVVRQFLDGFTKLQTLLETSLPPDPRLRVNEALFRHGVIPVETSLFSGKQEKPSLRAEHLTAPLLSKRDRARIDAVIDQLSSFEEVSNKDFHSSGSVAAN